jgi:hypothetical protein
LPELNQYDRLAQDLETLRNKTEHDDHYSCAKKDDLIAFVKQMRSLNELLPSLKHQLHDKQSAADLDAQRNLLQLMLFWLERDLAQTEGSYESFGLKVHDQTVKHAKSLIAYREKVKELTLEEISELLDEVRVMISEIDDLDSTLSGLMAEEAAASYG